MDVEKRIEALEREIDQNNESALDAYVALGEKVQKIGEDVQSQRGMLTMVVHQVKKLMGTEQ